MSKFGDFTHRCSSLLTSESLTPTFTKVVQISELVSGNSEILNLINRPELSVTISKIHAWRLTEYEKAVFLDADCLVLKTIDELFERSELSAVCDLGWVGEHDDRYFKIYFEIY